eukprot:Nk52_evm2s383 gene=Nk52_evmTU2s383
MDDIAITKYPSAFTRKACHNPRQDDFEQEVCRKCAQGRYKRGSAKVVVLGDVGVGKTSLLQRLVKNEFCPNYKATIGVDFMARHFDILGCDFTLHLWDTAGQERFKSIASSYYRGADAVILVYDMDKCASLDSCEKWLNEAREQNSQSSSFVSYLVGSKRDLLDQTSYGYTAVSSVALQISQDLNAEYWETSAATGENITELFQRIAVKSIEEKCIRYIGDQFGEAGRGMGGSGSSGIGMGRGSIISILDEDTSNGKATTKRSCC